jgi:hypothetical protein
VVEGTSDRVTQPGKIAIIYSQSPEGREYRGYIEYLQSLGYLTSEVEELDVGELQGVQGLHALRVAGALETRPSCRAWDWTPTRGSSAERSHAARSSERLEQLLKPAP